MLVLSRRVGEKIVIGDGIILVVKRIAGHRVTLGVEAPHDVHIMRSELKPFAQTPTRNVAPERDDAHWENSLAAPKPR